MSLTVSQDEGTTIITITSNPKNKWPIFCQILGYLLCNPVCSVSEDMKLTDTQRALGIVQIIVAVMNLVLGCFGVPWASSVVTYGGLHIIVIVLSVLQLCVAIFFCVLTIKSLNKKGGSAKLVEDKTAESRSGISQYSSPFGHSCNITLTASQDMKKKMTDTHTALGIVQIIVGVMNITAGCFGFDSFWIGGVFLVVGILCVLAVKVPSRLLLVFLVILNIVSAALAVLAFVLFSAELTTGTRLNCDENHYRHHSSYNDFANGALEGKTSIEICLYYRDLIQMILGGLEIMMIVLSFLQLFVTIGFCVWTVKALFTLAEDAKAVEDPELYHPLLEEDTASAA